MDAMTLTSRADPMTRADLDALPDDGYRHELIDGVLLMTPSPSFDHQRVLAGLYRVLHAACPPDLEVLFAPFDVALDDSTVLEPDLLIARRDAFTSRDLPSAPLLAVEVLSPSTRRFDLTVKRDRYESAGTAAYWVVDPVELTLTAWELTETGYVEVAHVTGEETFTATTPYDVSVSPARLRD